VHMDTGLLLWIAVFVALAVAAPLLWRRLASGSDERRYAYTSLAEVRRMNWRELEHFLGYLFTREALRLRLPLPAFVVDSSGKGDQRGRRLQASQSSSIKRPQVIRSPANDLGSLLISPGYLPTATPAFCDSGSTRNSHDTSGHMGKSSVNLQKSGVIWPISRRFSLDAGQDTPSETKNVKPRGRAAPSFV
jgi:hypothetical protein